MSERFYLSSDINVPFQLKVSRLECIAALGGEGAEEPSMQLIPSDAEEERRPLEVYAVCSLHSGGEPLGADVRTRGAPVTAAAGAGAGGGEEATPSPGSGLASEAAWEEWLSFCVKYRDLPRDAKLAVAVWGVPPGQPDQRRLVGGTVLDLFSKRRARLKAGRQRLQVHGGAEPDPSPGGNSTPGKGGRAPELEAMERLERALKRYERGEVERVDWLDGAARSRVAEMQAAARRGLPGRPPLLLLELPDFDYAVYFQEAVAAHHEPLLHPGGGLQAPPGGPAAAPAPSSSSSSSSSASPASQGLPPGAGEAAGGGAPGPEQQQAVVDPEVGRDNPAEKKAQKLARSVTRGVIDRDLKPDGSERRVISRVLRLPPGAPLSGEERQLLWRLRYALTGERRALTKFLKCVDWGDAGEAGQVVKELIPRWVPIDVADALELLSPEFTNDDVRAYAVSVLGRAGDDELLLYLLQLVQAVRYERADDSPLAGFLVRRAVGSRALANALHWYLYVEAQGDIAFGPRFVHVHSRFVEAQVAAGPRGEAAWESIRVQTELTAQLCKIVDLVAATRGGTERKVERLRSMLSEQGLCGELVSVPGGIPLPYNPQVTLTGVVPGESSVFRSALHPLRLAFRTAAGGQCTVIFKKGDDLRQDQLVVQMISLMDRLLKRESLDLRLTPYRVLSTGCDHGLIEFVPTSQPLSMVLRDHRAIATYLSLHSPDPEGPYGMAPEVLETFVRSCAGYCVITFILGVGDRHLDNLLLATDGRIFHIDFGFIMGRDPKLGAPPMKLCKEMVEAMGGAGSAHYARFQSYCCEAYNILRKSSNLILNLFHLMAGSSLPDIAADPEKVILKLQEKLRPDLDDEAAVQFFQQLINDCASAFFQDVLETAHRWAQYWR